MAIVIKAADAAELSRKLFDLDPPKSNNYRHYSKRQKERGWFSRAMSTLAVANPTLFPCECEESESPDFRLTSREESVIGVEVTGMHDEAEMRNSAILRQKAKAEGKTEWSVIYSSPAKRLVDTREASLEHLGSRMKRNIMSSPPVSGYAAEKAWVDQLRSLVSGKNEKLQNYDVKIEQRWLVVADSSAWRGYIDSETWSVLLEYLREETATINSGEAFQRVLVLTRDMKMLEIVDRDVREHAIIDHWHEFVGTTHSN